ncbi:hypothetical protein PG994_014615 [Apiospora phragmitis]|uniref:Uncharacterized protein n=1 Tax=Apiospora phragmitis TaxID=2905665 RepID=A0ABR1T4V5_9PEZI
MSAFRSPAIRTSLRALTRRPAPTRVARRSYATQHASDHGASQSSDLPWMIAGGGALVGGMAYLLPTGSGSKKLKDPRTHHGEHKRMEPDQAKTAPDEEKKEEGPSTILRGDPKASYGSSQTGTQVPPPPSDNESVAGDWDKKKEGHEEVYKKTTEEKATKVASSSSDMPSKRTAAEDPSEDPKKGEGEAVKKGGPAKDD